MIPRSREMKEAQSEWTGPGEESKGVGGIPGTGQGKCVCRKYKERARLGGGIPGN